MRVPKHHCTDPPGSARGRGRVYACDVGEGDRDSVCQHLQAEYHRVQVVCSRLGIECLQVDYIKEYWNSVFSEILTGCATVPQHFRPHHIVSRTVVVG